MLLVNICVVYTHIHIQLYTQSNKITLNQKYQKNGKKNCRGNGNKRTQYIRYLTLECLTNIFNTTICSRPICTVPSLLFLTLLFEKMFLFLMCVVVVVYEINNK